MELILAFGGTAITRAIKAGVATSLLLALAACASEAEPEEDAGEPQPGTITGKLTFPSSYLPDDLLVCAQKVSSKEVTCKGGFEGTRYSIDLDPGSYFVWSQTNGMQGYRAFYTVAVPCGLTVECTDHTPLEVELGAGQTLEDIDPGDWYDRDQ